MDLETFWRFVGDIRDRAETTYAADDEALANCVVDVIADRLTPDEILAFDAAAGDLFGLVDIPAMEPAMFLIEGCISDDSFMDSVTVSSCSAGGCSRPRSLTRTHSPSTCRSLR